MSSTQQLLLGEGAGSGPPVYIEDVFSTYLYTGNATTGQSINNGIDLATKGGLLWCKNRTTASTPHYLFDTARDFSYTNAAVLNSASTAAQEDKGTDYAKPETNGFSFGSGAGSTSPNKSGDAFASWTFRKQPKFFDVVTWTGDGTTNRSIAHNLQSMPGFIIVKRTDSTSNWYVVSRLANTDFLVSVWTTPAFFALNSTGAAPNDSAATNVATSSEFYLKMGGDATASVSYTNINNATYVAYLFAHDAGGFGLTGTDNVISCGSFTTDGSGNASVTLGYEPQWVLVKSSSNAENWYVVDNMRGFPVSGDNKALLPNLSNAEGSFSQPNITNTGFAYIGGNASRTYIYIAIRRGPMKVPTVGTTVFVPVLSSTTPTVLTSNFPVDMALSGTRTPGAYEKGINDRLRGFSNTSSGTSPWIVTNSSASESANTGTPSYYSAGNTSITIGDYFSGATLSNYLFGRAPGFMDVVCWTNTGATQSINHNLGVAPELIITKRRPATENWQIYSATTGASAYLTFTTAAVVTGSTNRWNATSPTASVFTTGTAFQTSETYVAYLFATCAGVSKVGSYTGTGATLQIDCGFTAGSRFIMIKRTDDTGDWYVWDSARGIIAGNDPYLLLNSSAAEVTNTDYVDTYSAGFEITSTAPAAINASAGTFIFLAIA